MRIWFVCKVKYQKEEENGRWRNVTEAYLVDAMSFTEAEARIYEELGSIITGDFVVSGIAKSRIVDVFHYEDADIWYKCKMTYYVTEESGKEKKITNLMLVSAADVKQAYDRIFESMSGMLVTFSVPEVAESTIVEIFTYDTDKNEKIPDNLTPLSELDN